MRHWSHIIALSVLLPVQLPSPTAMFAKTHGQVLFPFPAPPACGSPLATLVADKNGNFYGTGSSGGPANAGCVFELSRTENGWEENVIHIFSGGDGSNPRGALVFDRSGNL